MNKITGAALFLGMLGLAWGSYGCAGLTNPSSSVTPIINVTQAYQTVEFRLTQAMNTPTELSQLPLATSTLTPDLVETKETLPTTTPLPTTEPPTATAPSATPPCDQAAAGNPIDVSIPDDSEIMPGQSFTKIWRLQNTGTCTWTTDYAVRFFYGAQMSAPEAIPLRQAVAPGQTIEIAVDMVAPQSPGIHQGNWKLRNSTGQLFGIGPNGDAPFWVRINVMKPFTSSPSPTNTLTATPTLTPTSSPTITASPTTILQAQGTLSLVLNTTLNLDTGEINPATGKDLIYQIDANGFHLLVPQENAVLGVFGGSEPTLQACLNATMSKAGLALESLPPKTHLCYRTDLGLSGWLYYVSLSTADQSISIEFQTWGVAAP